MADDSSSLFPLHSCVYRNDIRQLSSLLRTTDINQKDKHGDFSFTNLQFFSLVKTITLFVVSGIKFLREHNIWLAINIAILKISFQSIKY